MTLLFGLFALLYASPGFLHEQPRLFDNLPIQEFWTKAQTASSGDTIDMDIDGNKVKLCPERKGELKTNMKLGDLFVDGALSKDRLNKFLEKSMWVEGKVCDTNDKFNFISTEKSTKGSIFFNGIEKILKDGKLSEATTGASLEDPNETLTEEEKEIIKTLFPSSVDQMNIGRRSLDRTLKPGEVDIFVKVDINPDVVEHIGGVESTVTYALNLFSWINAHVYYPIGFNVQVSDINIRTQPCGSQCMKKIREAGQPSNAHLVHHMTKQGALGYGSVGGLYTRSKFGGVSTCPKIKGNFGLWERICVAHELGHNFGGVHTHDQKPAIDSCGKTCSSGGGKKEMDVAYGTIMSYCHKCSGGYRNIEFEFHKQTADSLLRLYDRQNTQLNQVAPGTVGIDLATLAPWSTTQPRNGPSGPRFGGGLLPTTTKASTKLPTTKASTSKSVTTKFVSPAKPTSKASTIPEINIDVLIKDMKDEHEDSSSFALTMVAAFICFALL